MTAFSINWSLIEITALIATIFACFTSAGLITSHIRNFVQPKIQSKIIGCIYMCPIYAFDSLLGILFPSSALLINLFRDCYEVCLFISFL